MAANKEKYINLALIHIIVLSAIFLIGYFIKDAEEIRKRQEECEKRCYPAKPVKTLSVRHCMCLEEETLDTEQKPEQYLYLRRDMISPTQFYLIVDRFGNIVAFRDRDWKPSDVSPYKVLHWTGIRFVEID